MEVILGNKYKKKIEKNIFYKKNKILNKKLEDILKFFKKSNNLFEVFSNVKLNLHKLKHDRKDLFSVNIDKMSGERILFKINSININKINFDIYSKRFLKKINSIEIVFI